MTRRTALFTACLALVVALVGCNPAGPTSKAANAKLRVVSTIGMIHDAVREIGGDHVESEALMGPGIDPHLYRATAGDVRRLEEADVVLYCGLELEGRMEEILHKLGDRKTTVAVTRDVPKDQLVKPAALEGRYDPHIWFDVELWTSAVKTVADVLIAEDPAHAADYKARLSAYLQTLEKLHEEVRAAIAAIPEDQRVLITAHDAFGYFGRKYGMEVHGIQGTSTATEAGAADVRALAGLIARRKIKAIFVESSVPRATVEALQKAVVARGWQVRIGEQLFSDAMGNEGTPEGTYVGMVRHNVRAIVNALK